MPLPINILPLPLSKAPSGLSRLLVHAAYPSFIHKPEDSMRNLIINAGQSHALHRQPHWHWPLPNLPEKDYPVTDHFVHSSLPKISIIDVGNPSRGLMHMHTTRHLIDLESDPIVFGPLEINPLSMRERFDEVLKTFPIELRALDIPDAPFWMIDDAPQDTWRNQHNRQQRIHYKQPDKGAGSFLLHALFKRSGVSS